ncbi:hypothetical protein T05_15577 [Trichinella murrelli]|uniref:Uncharacterized protein n=1 Tax=Trichinella murrelli TaxID=144512 RepID=A0A0V0TZ29_9BILA|nr:hypothetical protein T05_15577 [Trichinella murrelli]
MCGYVIELSLRLAHASNSVPIKEEYFSRKSQNFMGYTLGFLRKSAKNLLSKFSVNSNCLMDVE